MADDPRPASLFTWRSFLLGLGLVVFMSAYVPFEHAWGVNWIEGAYMPTMAFLAIALMAIANALVHRLAPQKRFTAAEYGLVTVMILAASGVVNVGLFRQLPGNITNIWLVAQENLDWKTTLEGMDLPDWLFPTLHGDTVDERATDEVVQNFYGRTPLEDRSFTNQVLAVPWRAWLRPAVGWGAFVVCLWGACLCLVILFRRQWVENERLPFPIAQVYLALIEPPEQGRAFNRLWTARSLWIAFAVVYALGLSRGLHMYFPKIVPEIPQGYDFKTLFSEQPWSYTTWGLKEHESISYTLIAVCLFVTTKVSFSLWFFFIASQVVRMYVGYTFQREITGNQEMDQAMGAFLAYGLATAWVAKQHLGMVMKQMMRGARGGEPTGRYLPYIVVGWALVAFTGGMTIWLHLAGTSLAGGLFISVWLLFCLTALARLVAETGLVFVVFTLPINRWFVIGLQDLPRWLAFRTTTETYFHTNLLGGVFLQDLGHSFSPHAATGLRMADASADERDGGWKRTWPVIACIGIAAIVAYLVAGAGVLTMEYNYSVTTDHSQAFVNDWGAVGMSRWFVLQPTSEYAPPRTGPQEPHSRLGHFAFGAGVTALCSFLRLRYDAWPLHPVGFLLVYGWGINRMWFSIFLGWLLKVLVVKFGGAKMLRNIRPFFLGMILGEAGAGLTWSAVSLLRLGLGMDYYSL